MASVILERVTKRYGDKTVIPGFDLEVRAHELLVLLGPSGCGKSTLLRIVAGLDSPTSGTIRIGDRIVNDLPPRDRDVAMVFQSYALYPHMSVRENLGFGLAMRRVPLAARERAVADAARILGLEELLDRRPRQLSGGQRQRVAVGRAIVRKPAVFLFDEPLSNLDAKLRLQTRGEIGRLQRDLGTTTIYVTHDQVEAMTLGHRIALLDAGRLQQLGPPLELYERPANRFVAGFIGSPPMNFFPAVANTSRTLAGAGFCFVLPGVGTPACLVEGERVVVGVRPEQLTLVPESTATACQQSGTENTEPGRTFVQGEVELVEPLGAETVIYLRVGDTRIAARTSPVDVPAVGDRATLTADPSRLHLFDAGSGARLA